ncbi:MAG: hypothetical protein KC800_01560 [Candidatus Eremiobacteraeota bacterium]|nr:hypothetical protein [Candidatus Eremiobacteraeota bacterium]
MQIHRAERGLSLIEIVFVVSLFSVLFAVTLSSLKPGAAKVSTLGLATALGDEFRAARQLSISKGYPVAIGLPAGGDKVADSIYRLEGWNKPLVTWTISFAGDYPRLEFAAAGWDGGDFEDGAALPPLSKFGAFDLSSWIPNEQKTDAILCFTPDGGVLSNGLPSIDGKYTVIVAGDLAVSGGTATAGNEPCLISLAINGAISVSKGIPGGVTLPTAVAAADRSAIEKRDEQDDSCKVWLSEIRTKPEATEGDVDAFCSPGQHVTFEMYAYDPEGRELFAQWRQSGPGGKEGNFGFPRSRSGLLTSEVERMEFVQNPPSDIEWNGAPEPTAGCFRARWTWTVPQDSEENEIYTVEADVQDATGQAKIQNRMDPKKFRTSPEGRLLAEINDGTRWTLVRLNPDGSCRQLLTSPGIEELMPSVDAQGTKLAFLQGPIGNDNQRVVKVRSLSGGGEFAVTSAGRYTSVSLSPDGGWISYRLDDGSNQGQGTLYIKRLDPGAPVFSTSQVWEGTNVLDIEPGRTGWSPDNKYALWSDRNTIRVADLTSGGHVTNARTLYTQTNTSSSQPGLFLQTYAPTVFNPGSGERVLFTVSTANPVIVHIPFDPDNPTYGNAKNIPPCETLAHKIDLDGWGGDTGSGSFDDNYASVSKDGRKVVLPRIDRPSDNTRYAIIAKWNDGIQNFIAQPTEKNTIREPVRCVVWVP